jgi:hypothetical protein
MDTESIALSTLVQSNIAKNSAVKGQQNKSMNALVRFE